MPRKLLKVGHHHALVARLRRKLVIADQLPARQQARRLTRRGYPQELPKTVHLPVPNRSGLVAQLLPRFDEPLPHRLGDPVPRLLKGVPRSIRHVLWILGSPYHYVIRYARECWHLLSDLFTGALLAYKLAESVVRWVRLQQLSPLFHDRHGRVGTKERQQVRASPQVTGTPGLTDKMLNRPDRDVDQPLCHHG